MVWGIYCHPGVRCGLPADTLFVLWSGQTTGQHGCWEWCPGNNVEGLVSFGVDGGCSCSPCSVLVAYVSIHAAFTPTLIFLLCISMVRP